VKAILSYPHQLEFFNQKTSIMKLMAKIFGVIFMMLISVTLVTAQVSIGLKAGLNLAKDHFNEESINEFTEFMPALYFAVPVELGISDIFAIQAEPGFIQKGVKMVEETVFEYEPGVFRTTDLDARTKFNFINLPILAKAKFGSETVKFFAIAGPEVAYALNAKTKMEMTVTNGITEKMEESEDIDFEEDKISRWDYGLIFGAGVEAQIGSGWITLDGRYNLGLNNYIQLEGEDVTKAYHRGIGILIGYKVPIQ
jgi:hypothetical protein